REIFILVHAQEQGVPEELLSAGSLAGEQALWQRLSRRLQERLALTAEAAHWAVESWALALDVAPLHYRYPRLLRLFIDALARFEPAAMGRALWQFMQTGGRSLHDNGVQWFGWKRSGSNARQFTLDRFRAGRWIGATLLVL